MKYKNALLPETSQELFLKWQDIINSNELCSIICPPFSGREYRINNFIEWQESNKFSTAKVIHLFIELFSHPEDIETVFKNTEKPLIFIPGEILLEKENKSILAAITFYKNKYKRAVLIFFESSLTEIQTTCEKNNEKLLQNIEYIPLLDKRNTEHFAKHLAERWDFLLLEREISLLYQYTGGQMWLIKETLRQVHKHKISISEAFQSDELRAKTNKIWNKLSSDYKKTLVKKDLGLSKSISTLELKKLNLIQDDLKANNTAEFISELSERVTISIHYTSSEIFFNEINVTSFFSQQEFQLIQRFSENLNNILSREEVAKIFWPDGNYSDWALDKAISRFRKRLESLGISKKSVVTLREKGYQFLLNK